MPRCAKSTLDNNVLMDAKTWWVKYFDDLPVHQSFGVFDRGIGALDLEAVKLAVCNPKNKTCNGNEAKL